VDEIASFYHENPAYTISFSQDNKILVTADESGIIQAWDIQNKTRLCRFEYPGKVSGIDITDDNQYIVASGDDKALRVFSMKTYKELYKFIHPMNVTQFN
jgi:WD40 repeat protein